MEKRFYIVPFIVIVLLGVLGFIFVFGDGIFNKIESSNFFGNSNNNIVEGGDNGSVYGGDIVSSGGGSGGSGSVFGDSESCSLKQIKYSLKNFYESVNCLEWDGGVCSKMNVNCSVEIHNLDVGEGVFFVRYSIVDSMENELDYVFINKSVAHNFPQVLRAGFVLEGEEAVDLGTTCYFEMESVPKKEVCN